MAYSKESYESSKKYKEKNIKRIPLDVQIEEYERIKQAAIATGETVNGFIKRAIKDRLSQNQVEICSTNELGADGAGLKQNGLDDE